MTARHYRAEQLVFALAITAGGAAVAVGLIGKWLWNAMDEAVMLPRRAR